MTDFNPLGFCPKRYRKKYEKLGEKAKTSYANAVKLKCIDCCAWYYTEAKVCKIKECPLWAVSNKVFKRTGNKGTGGKK